MLGKAELLSAEDFDCQGILNDDVTTIKDEWGKLTNDQKPRDSESAADVVNRAYHDLYDSLDNVSGPACRDVASMGLVPLHPQGVGVQLIPVPVHLTISPACLARQIRAVMTNRQLGPWKNENGALTPQLGGTSADKLPCLSEFPPKIKVSGLGGDWDIAVIKYTRLASLLYRYGQSDPSFINDVDAALDALNTRFLTLRSSPDQGATARETFNLMTSCGNLPNQFGSAADTVNGTGTDPGADRYSNDAKQAIHGNDSFGKKLLHFLKALFIVLAIAALAAIIGSLAGVAFGLLGLGSAAVAAAAIIAAVVGGAAFITFAFGGIEETENHLLMQNTSRYLKNKLMMAELRQQSNKRGFDTISNLNEDVRSWLLDHLQKIAREDFVEYNAKPYNSFSHASILNLVDFACDVSWDYNATHYIRSGDTPCDDKDRAIVTAASAVLDLSAAKDAVGSLEGRRYVPYRRLVEQNYVYYAQHNTDSGMVPPHEILDLGCCQDGQLAALQIWTGQMRHAPDGVATLDRSFGELVWYSTSHYRPDPLILDIAVKKTVAREQQYRHHTRERYVSGPGWLITAGGTDEGPAQGLRYPFFTIYPKINSSVVDDQGVGVPTTLMTGAQIIGKDGKPRGRDLITQFLRFEGNTKHWGMDDFGNPLTSFSDNNCVAGSFACGLGLRLPDDWDEAACHTQNIAPNFFVVDSTKCPAFNENENHHDDIFIAIFQSPHGWGFFEVAQQDAFKRDVTKFVEAIKQNNQNRFDKWQSASSSDRVEYFAVTQNRLLQFTPQNEDFGANKRACGIVNHESGARLTISDVPAVQQGACLSVGPRIFIDLNEAKNPIRRGEGGLNLEPFAQ